MLSILSRIASSLFKSNRNAAPDKTDQDKPEIALLPPNAESAHEDADQTAPTVRPVTKAAEPRRDKTENDHKPPNEAKSMAEYTQNNKSHLGWDMDESSLILEGYLDIYQGNKPKDEVIRRVSADLRQMAVNQGIEIDAAFRNEKRIEFQMYSMDSAFTGKDGAFPAKRIFSDTVALYRENPDQYHKLLQHAKDLVAGVPVPENQSDLAPEPAAGDELSGKRQPVWDQYEAVILLEGYLETAQGKYRRDEMVQRVSRDLRQMALNRGMTIDDAYRNKNGISRQMYSMDSAYQGKTLIQPATKLFTETVELYRTEPEKYLDLLNEAKAMAAGGLSAADQIEPKTPGASDNKTAFLQWADRNVDLQTSEQIAESLSKIEKFADSSRLISGSLYDVTDAAALAKIRNAVEGDKEFQIKYRDSIKSINAAFRVYMQYCGRLPTLKGTQPKPKPTLPAPLPFPPTPTDPSPDPRSVERDFYTYLRHKAGLAGATCRLYVTSIKDAERWAAAHGCASHVLFGEDKETTRATAAALYADPDFIAYSIDHHNRFTAAINKLLNFYGLEIPLKASPTGAGDPVDPPPPPPPPPLTLPQELKNGIAAVLKEHFKYGFRPDSIDTKRFRDYASEMGVVLPTSDEALKFAIGAIGIVIKGIIYYRDEDMLRELRRIVDAAIASGARVIFFESLFARCREWFESQAVTSADMLGEYVGNIGVEGWSFSKNKTFIIEGFKQSEQDAVADEMERVWGDGQTQSPDRLGELLPYIPQESIRETLKKSGKFMPNGTTYLLQSRFHLTREQAAAILDFVKRACDAYGSVVFSDIPLEDVCEANWELERDTVYDMIYAAILWRTYARAGSVISKDQALRSPLELLKKHIAAQDACTFDEIAEKAAEISPSLSRQDMLRALYDGMVRVDKKRFTADRHVQFAVDEIDDELARRIPDHFCAVQDVIPFSAFPYCGRSWNSYLLESYCYRFSKRYSLRLNSNNFNDRNVGIIAEKDYAADYTEMLARAAARSRVLLTPEAVGRYLSDAGYIGRSDPPRAGQDRAARQRAARRRMIACILTHSTPKRAASSSTPRPRTSPKSRAPSMPPRWTSSASTSIGAMTSRTTCPTCGPSPASTGIAACK